MLARGIEPPAYRDAVSPDTFQSFTVPSPLLKALSVALRTLVEGAAPRATDTTSVQLSPRCQQVQ